ncbi:MAG: hypothetical protein IJ752_06000 [Alphaproteobacteria bacterium]|nr:hypothetical protein [Alphaproteobacteria bacterium]
MANERLSFRAFLKDAVFYDEDGNEYNKSFYLYDVSLYKDLDCGIGRDDLEKQLREQCFSEKEIRRIEEDEFNSWEDDWYLFVPSVIEQCTGLKDENGKLIFEGDILEAPFEHYDGNSFSLDIIRCWVVFYCGTLRFKTIEGEYRDFTDPNFCMENSFMAVNVIGNIHENAAFIKRRKITTRH